MSEHNEEEYTPSSNPELSTMWEMLSKQRQGELNNMIIKTIDKFKGSGQLEVGKIYPFELTHGFDQQEPKQYVYLMCAFRLTKLDNPIIVNKNIPPVTTGLDIALQTVEVFKEESMFNWLDHVNRIEKNNRENKENQLFYEDNIFKQEKDKETEKEKSESVNNNKVEENKKDKRVNPNQCNINKPIEGDANTDMNNNSIGVMIGRVDYSENIELENNEYSIKHGIPKKELFDFYEENEPDKPNDKYLSIFKTFSRNIVNHTTVTYYNHRVHDDKADNDVLKLIHALKNLQVSFCKCNFWNFNRNELGQLGFMNWSDDVLLIPVWAFPIILKNSKDKIVYTPTSEQVLVRDIDIHEKPMVKYGCVPYGFKISELKS